MYIYIYIYRHLSVLNVIVDVGMQRRVIKRAFEFKISDETMDCHEVHRVKDRADGIGVARECASIGLFPPMKEVVVRLHVPGLSDSRLYLLIAHKAEHTSRLDGSLPVQAGRSTAGVPGGRARICAAGQE